MQIGKAEYTEIEDDGGEGGREEEESNEKLVMYKNRK